MNDLLNKRTTIICRPMTEILRQRQWKSCHSENHRSGTRHASFLMLVLLLFYTLFFNMANAGNLSLLVNGKSWHLNPPRDTEYNENNWGAGIQYDLESNSRKWIPFLTASGFIDSFDNPSYYTGAGFVRRMHFDQRKDSKHIDAGLIGFFMTRKDFKGGDPFFGMLPVLSFGTRQYAVNMTYIPKVDPKMVALWFFQFKISIDNF